LDPLPGHNGGSSVADHEVEDLGCDHCGGNLINSGSISRLAASSGAVGNLAMGITIFGYSGLLRQTAGTFRGRSSKKKAENSSILWQW